MAHTSHTVILVATHTVTRLENYEYCKIVCIKYSFEAKLIHNISTIISYKMLIYLKINEIIIIKKHVAINKCCAHLLVDGKSEKENSHLTLYNMGQRPWYDDNENSTMRAFKIILALHIETASADVVLPDKDSYKPIFTCRKCQKWVTLSMGLFSAAVC